MYRVTPSAEVNSQPFGQLAANPIQVYYAWPKYSCVERKAQLMFKAACTKMPKKFYDDVSADPRPGPGQRWSAANIYRVTEKKVGRYNPCRAARLALCSDIETKPEAPDSTPTTVTRPPATYPTVTYPPATSPPATTTPTVTVIMQQPQPIPQQPQLTTAVVPQESSPQTILQAEEEPEAEETEEEDDNNAYVIGGVLAVLVIGGGLAYYASRKKKGKRR